MSNFGEDLIQSLSEALAHARGEGLATVHAPVDTASGSMRSGVSASVGPTTDRPKSRSWIITDEGMR